MEIGGGRVDLSLFEHLKIAWLPWVLEVYSWDELEGAVRYGWMWRR